MIRFIPSSLIGRFSLGVFTLADPGFDSPPDPCPPRLLCHSDSSAGCGAHSPVLPWLWFYRGADLGGATVEHLAQFGNPLVKVSLSGREPIDSRFDDFVSGGTFAQRDSQGNTQQGIIL
jgi:hypothetical protein